MRLWSIHPRYLDAQGLVALWREALLAQAVLRGKTRGYRHHPQLKRFQEHPLPISAMNAYLGQIHSEAVARGYSFDSGKVGPRRRVASIPVTTGQLRYEWRHLMRKLRKRSPDAYRNWRGTESPGSHPLFRRVGGPVAEWEKIK
jgi:Pyrimidine dimer DNA glycosylase